MAWSAKLQSGTGGVAGFNEWELVYNVSTQTAYKAKYGFSLGNVGPEVLYHTPDNGSPTPIRANGRNRLIFLTVDTSKQTNWDNVVNLVTVLARLVDGPDSQAARAQIDDTAEKVRVKILPDGATNATYYEVLHGFVDSSTSFTDSIAILNTMAREVTIALTCAPLGYGDAFTLRNDLPSSPHMIEDSNADGLADGLTLVGAPTPTISTNRYLTGGKSQKLTTDTSSNQGAQTDTVAVAAGVAVVGYVDLVHSGDNLSIILRDDVAVIQVKTFTANDGTGVSSKRFTDPFGATFYRVEVSGTTTALSTNCYIQVRRVVGDATQATQIWIDKIYLQITTSTIPPAFASSAALKNRDDPAATTAATRQQINYLDVWGVPGDAPALVKYQLSLNLLAAAQLDSTLIAARYNYSKGSLRSWTHVHDNTGALGGTISAGAWATVADATAVGGSYIATGTTSPTWANPVGFYLLFDEDDVALFFTRQCRLFARCKKVGADTITVAFDRLENASGTLTGNTVTVTPNDTWIFIDLGMWLPAKDLATLTPTSYTGGILWDVFSTGTATDFRIDAIWAFPVEGELAFIYTFDKWIPTEILTIDGVSKTIYEEANFELVTFLGSLHHLIPGEENRIIFAKSDTTVSMSPADAFIVTTTITPRTAHLLGTI